MKLDSLKICNIQKRGKELLINLTGEQQDDARKLFEIQINYLLSTNDILENCSERIRNIIFAGKRYLNYEEDDILDVIARQDQILEKHNYKSDVFLLEDILYIYYDVPQDKALNLIEEVDEKDREKNQIISKFIVEQLVKEINKTYTISKESTKKLSTKMPKEKTEIKKSNFEM